jgi:hypothetical protein
VVPLTSQWSDLESGTFHWSLSLLTVAGRWLVNIRSWENRNPFKLNEKRYINCLSNLSKCADGCCWWILFRRSITFLSVVSVFYPSVSFALSLLLLMITSCFGYFPLSLNGRTEKAKNWRKCLSKDSSFSNRLFRDLTAFERNWFTLQHDGVVIFALHQQAGSEKVERPSILNAGWAFSMELAACWKGEVMDFQGPENAWRKPKIHSLSRTWNGSSIFQPRKATLMSMGHDVTMGHRIWWESLPGKRFFPAQTFSLDRSDYLIALIEIFLSTTSHFSIISPICTDLHNPWGKYRDQTGWRTIIYLRRETK